MRKKIVDKLVEEFSENVDDSEMIYNVTLNDYENVYGLIQYKQYYLPLLF